MKSSSPFIAVALATLSFCSVLLAQQDEMPANSIQRKLRSMRGSESLQMMATRAPNIPSVANWTAATASPTAIARYAFAQVGQDLYVISGATVAGPVTPVNRYNATTNAWTPRTPIPVGSEAAAATYSSFNNKILRRGRLRRGSVLRVYDIATNSWTALSARPGFLNSYGAAAGSYQDNIFIVGGGIDATPTVSIYNITSNSSSNRAECAGLVSIRRLHPSRSLPLPDRKLWARDH